ncbi:GyrI-like domain-containing protein [Paenibacillus sp. TRM 82003]|nr:GyrI-like domain-containing protein [Paenibacillus sp. TRM 82003]
MELRTTFAEDGKHNVAGQLMNRYYGWRQQHGDVTQPVYMFSFFPEDFEPSMPFAIFGGSEYQDGQPIPEGMVVRDIPSLQVAVVTHKGPISSIRKTYDFYLKRWQPRSDYKESHPFHYQKYTDRFLGVDHPASELDLCFPVTLRQEQETLLPSSVPALNFDGGMIDILWDHHEDAIRWYVDAFGWKADPTYDWTQDQDADEERMTQLSFGTWLKSVRTNRRLHHLFADRGGPDPHVRWCWNTKDLVAAREHFVQKGIRVSEIYHGAGDRHYFDLWAWEGTRLSVCGWPESGEEGGPLLIPGWVRIGVSNVEEGRRWYEEHVGMEWVEENSENGWALMKLGVEHHSGRSLWCLEKLPDDAYRGPIDGPARPYCVIHDKWKFESYHRFLRERGVAVSEISGNPPIHGFSFFHFYDPDGNRFNVWRY